MRTDRARSGRPLGADPGTRYNWRSRWRVWLPFLVKPLRGGIIIFVLLLVIEYLVVPELVGASKDLDLLGRVNPAWLAAGVVLEGASLFCYGLLTQAVLPAGAHNPGLSRLFRIDLAAAAVAHVIPAGTLGSAGIGYRLFTAEGINGRDAAVMMATKGLGSTAVLNVLLWLSLVISIPLAGFHPIYVTVAITGAVVLLAIGVLVFGITRQSERASRILRTIGDRIPGLTGDRLEQAIGDAGNSLSALARDRRTLTTSLTWASLNWLLDAASLWCFVAAFGRMVNPVELFAAYGIANVAGVLPVTPAGLGVIDSVTPLLLVSFGITRSVATLGVLGWRLVNFWLPIPAGAAAYVSLKVPRGSGLKAMRAAVATLMSRPGPTDVPAQDAREPPGAEKPRIVRPNDRQQEAASRSATAARPDQRDRPESPGGLGRCDPEMALGHDQGRAADLYRIDPVALAGDRRVQHRRPADLRALADLDLLAEPDPAVPGQVDGQRARGRAGGRILGYADRRVEHPGLPRAAAAREAVRAHLQVGKGGEVRPDRGDRVLAGQLDVNERRAVTVQLDRQLGFLRAQGGEQFVRPLVRLPARDRLPHGAEDEPVTLAFQGDGHQARARLQGHGVSAQGRGDHERRAEDRMPREGQLGARCEDPDPDVAAFGRREEENGLGDVQFSRQLLHLSRTERPTVDEHAELVALERLGREDIAHEVRMKFRRSRPARGVRDHSSQSRHPVHSR
jgi:uncharacterized protein (TIRG00374 family)